jgi:hypothetical protein
MGREETCKCKWAGATANVHALLESSEIVLRGEIRRHIPFKQLQNISVQSDHLRFTIGHETVQLFLGASTAEKWATIINTPLPTLSKKLGITPACIVRTIGTIDDPALNAAIAEAAQISPKNCDLIVAFVDTPESLHATLKETKSQLMRSVPIWMVYAKGPGHPVNEVSIRSLLRSHGLIDTKVASVSTRLTALRFSLPKPLKPKP